jgi:hypothetical protein
VILALIVLRVSCNALKANLSTLSLVYKHEMGEAMFGDTRLFEPGEGDVR